MFSLGDLESVAMDQLWSANGPLTVGEIHERLSSHRRCAYTRVMTALDNLYREGWTHRELVGGAYVYRPALSRHEAAVRALREVLRSSGDPELTLLHFALSASQQEAAILRDWLPGRGRRR
jgi:predicted transcriptional regulator